MHRRALAATLIALVVGGVMAAHTSAQSLRDLLSDVFVFGDCGEALCLDHQFAETGDPLTEHGRHYLFENVPLNAALFDFVESHVVGLAGKLPATAMAGGRIWSDGDRSSSLGPIFAERAETLGAGRFFVGVEASGLKVTSLNGAPTDALVLNFFHEDSDVAVGPDPLLGQPGFERDVLQVRSNLDLELTAATLVLSAGLTSFFDIGVVVPVMRTRLRATADASILPFDSSFPHRFAGTDSNPVLGTTNSVSGSATGVGDISARMKISLTGGTPAEGAPAAVGVALLADVTFPTGQEEDLLGTGEGRGRALAIFSGRWGGFSPHINAGYLLRQGDTANDAVLGVVGFDARATAGVTVAADLITQWELGSATHRLTAPVTFVGPGGFTVPTSSIPPRERYLADLAVGLKFRVGSDMLLVTNALVPTRRTGLRPDIVWTFGLQGTFK